MRITINHLHKAFESRIRLGIMTAISVNNELDFNGLKELLDVTDGNLATHLRMLQKEEFIRVEKTFVDNKPNTKYYITKRGKAVFKEHLKALENIITAQK